MQHFCNVDLHFWEYYPTKMLTNSENLQALELPLWKSYTVLLLSIDLAANNLL